MTKLILVLNETKKTKNGIKKMIEAIKIAYDSYENGWNEKVKIAS